MERFGVDVGGVLMGGRNDRSFFTENYLTTPPLDGAFETLAHLVKVKFGDEVYIVSKCGPKNQARTLEWFIVHRFYELTGVLPEHVHFCENRHEKAPIARRLGLTHFIDNRLDILASLRGIVPQLYLFNPQDEAVTTERHKQHLPYVSQVESWTHAGAVILSQTV